MVGEENKILEQIKILFKGVETSPKHTRLKNLVENSEKKAGQYLLAADLSCYK